MGSIWDWTVLLYREGGRDFVVATKQQDPPVSEIEEDSLIALRKHKGSVIRGDKYLYPICMVHGMIKPHYVSRKSYSRQRKHIRMRDDDVVILTYQRSGTTWTEQLVLLLLHGARAEILNTREKNTYRPDVEGSVGKIFVETMFHGKGEEDEWKAEDLGAPWGTVVGQDIDITPGELDSLGFRRVFKTHTVPALWVGNGEQVEMLEDGKFPRFKSKVKIVYVVRDPKDTAISWYYSLNPCNFSKHGWPFAAFMRTFLDGKVPNGGWFEHTKGWMEVAREYPDQFCVVHYEDNKRDPMGYAREIADFLEVEVDDAELKRCVELSSFDTMKKMSETSKAVHVRKGEIGGWKEHLSQEMVDAFDNKLNDPWLGYIGELYKTK